MCLTGYRLHKCPGCKELFVGFSCEVLVMVCCGRSITLFAVCASPSHVVCGAGQSKCCSVYGSVYGPGRQ